METYHDPKTDHHPEEHKNDASYFWIVLFVIAFIGALFIYLGMR